MTTASRPDSNALWSRRFRFLFPATIVLMSAIGISDAINQVPLPQLLLHLANPAGLLCLVSAMLFLRAKSAPYYAVLGVAFALCIADVAGHVLMGR